MPYFVDIPTVYDQLLVFTKVYMLGFQYALSDSIFWCQAIVVFNSINYM